MYARYYGASLAEIDPLQVIREAFQLIYRLNLRLPTRFVMLDKAIATLGSVGVELYPDFNVFEVAKPYARGLMLERYTPQRVLKRARSEGLELARIARDLPYQVHDILEEFRDGQIEVGFVHKGLDEFMRKLDVGLQPARDRAGHGRRPDRLEPDRDLLDERPADRRRELPLVRRLRPLRDPRAVAALGRAPLRPVVESSSHFRAKGHLARARSRG